MTGGHIAAMKQRSCPLSLWERIRVRESAARHQDEAISEER
jgi:hypothetical protein